MVEPETVEDQRILGITKELFEQLHPTQFTPGPRPGRCGLFTHRQKMFLPSDQCAFSRGQMVTSEYDEGWTRSLGVEALNCVVVNSPVLFFWILAPILNRFRLWSGHNARSASSSMISAHSGTGGILLYRSCLARWRYSAPL
jgi:hypothetical protein